MGETFHSKFINLKAQFAFILTNCVLLKFGLLIRCNDCRKLFQINQRGKGGIVNWGYKRGITRSIKCARGGRGVRPKRASLRSWAFLLAKWRNPLEKKNKIKFSVTWQYYYPEQSGMENTNLFRYRQSKRLHVRSTPEGERVSQQDQTSRPDKWGAKTKMAFEMKQGKKVTYKGLISTNLLELLVCRRNYAISWFAFAVQKFGQRLLSIENCHNCRAKN